ncbi:MAG: VOC family protein [Algisphaera sp.]
MAHTNPVLQGAGIHHVALRTTQFDRSVAFYTNTLGCAPKLAWGDAGDRGVMLDVGDGNYIEVFERPEDSAVDSEARLLHLCLRCTNVNEVIERVRAAGCEITIEPKDVPLTNQVPDGTPQVTLGLAFFKGPDGEIIELMDCPDL